MADFKRLVQMHISNLFDIYALASITLASLDGDIFVFFWYHNVTIWKVTLNRKFWCKRPSSSCLSHVWFEMAWKTWQNFFRLISFLRTEFIPAIQVPLHFSCCCLFSKSFRKFWEPFPSSPQSLFQSESKRENEAEVNYYLNLTHLQACWCTDLWLSPVLLVKSVTINSTFSVKSRHHTIRLLMSWVL